MKMRKERRTPRHVERSVFGIGRMECVAYERRRATVSVTVTKRNVTEAGRGVLVVSRVFLVMVPLDDMGVK